MKTRRLASLVLAIAALALLVAACGSDSESDSSGSDPAALAPPTSPLYLEAALQPSGELKTNVEDLYATISGSDESLGEMIVSELEDSAAGSGEDFDFGTEVQPWLGEKGGMFFQKYDGEDFHGYGIAVQSTDTDATQAFIDDRVAGGDEPTEDGSYEGVEYKVQTDDGTTVGVIGDFLALAEEEGEFKLMVDASNDESLADADDFSETFDAASSDSLADVFVDIGALINQSGGTIDPDAKQFLDSAGIDPNEATAVASLIPGSNQIEIDFSTDLGGDNPPSGDASGLLSSLPASSFAAVASPDFGARIEEAIDEIDEEGIPGEIPPGKFKSTLKEANIDVDKIAGSIADLSVFASGNSESSLGGAVVLTTTGSKEATNTVSNIGLLLRAARTPGVTAIGGKASGFSVRSDDLGSKPIVVIAEGERIAIGYGLVAAKQGLAAGSGQTLGDNPTYKDAVSALGSTPITAFVDGPAALRLATAMIPADEEDFQEAKPYLAKIGYLALGAGSEGEQVTAKLIVGVK